MGLGGVSEVRSGCGRSVGGNSQGLGGLIGILERRDSTGEQGV